MTSLVSRARNHPRALTFLIIAAALVLAALAGRRPSAYLVLLGGGVLGGALLLRYPGLGLVVMAGLSFTLPLTFGTGSEVALTPPVLLVPAIVAVWLIDGLRRGAVRLPASRTLLPLLLFVASGLLSLVVGHIYWDPFVRQPDNLLLVQLAQWAIFALSAAIYIVMGDLGAREGGIWLRRATWLFLVLATVVLVEALLPDSARRLGWARPEMANRSMFWVWLPALATGQLLFNRRLKTWHRAGLLALLLAASYYIFVLQRTWSSGWVPFMTAALVVVMLWVWRRSRTLALGMALAFVVLAMVLYPVLFQHAGGESEFRLSWGGRQMLYRATIDLVGDHYLFGLGPASYRSYGFLHWLTRGPGTAFWVRPAISSHNNYIDVYAQQGLLGLGLFFWFLASVGFLGWRLGSRFQGDFRQGYVYGVLGGLAGILVAMMLGDWFLPFVYNIGFAGFRTSVLAWMFLGGLVALDALSRQNADD